MIEGADPASFSIIDHELSKDKNHVYWEKTILPQADPATFEYIPLDGCKDKNHKWKYSRDKDTWLIEE